jgi:hypothetical protein
MQFNLVGVASRKRIVPEIYAKPALPHESSENAVITQFEKETLRN